MSIEMLKTNFEDLFIIKPHKFIDHRGLYTKYFEKNVFETSGVNVAFSECSVINSHIGALRGLHIQDIEPQAKLIFVQKGSIFDVVVDLRPDSQNFGKYFSIYLDAVNNLGLFVPKGFAHGFLTLEDDTIVTYMSEGKYLPENQNGILWNDKILNIKWPIIDIEKILISQKDSTLLGIADYAKVKGYVL